jgi:pimeloyl-ACP methyl ester carboxylesterase
VDEPPRTIWGENGGVRIEAIEWSPQGDPADEGVPLVFMPGGTGNARSAELHGRAAAAGQLGAKPRRVLGVSRRGTGLSDAPPAGFAPADFAGDLGAAIAAAGYQRFVLFGHSFGVPISIEFALRGPEGLAGLVLGDAPARYADLKADRTFDKILSWPYDFAGWDEVFEWISRTGLSGSPDRVAFDAVSHRDYIERDGRIHRLVDRKALARTADESVTANVDYRARLGNIRCPVVLLLAKTGGSWMPPAEIAAYERAAPGVTVTRLASGHDLGQFGDAGPLHSALGSLLDRLDG